jgi:hypothetical protein
MHSTLYLVQFMLFGAALGLVCVSVPRYIYLPAWSRFAFGASLTPFFLAASTYCVALIAPGADRIAFVLVPVVIAGVALIFVGKSYRAVLTGLGRRFSRWTARCRAEKWPIVAIICLVPLAVYFCFVLAANASRPVIGHDALIYLSEAKLFALQRSLDVLNPGDGSPGGGLPQSHPHTSLFTLYLGHALLFSEGAIGYPNDGSARMAFQLTLPLLIIALSGLSAITRRPGALALTLCAFVMFSSFEYISSSHSRDAFRLTPVVVLAGLLISLLVRRRWTLGATLPVGVAASFSISGHTLNLYFLFLLALCFLGASAVFRIPARSVLGLTFVSSILALFPLSHYIKAYMRDGNLLGQGMVNFHLRDTPLMDAFRAYRDWGGADKPFLESIYSVVQQQSLVAVGATALAMAVLVVVLVASEKSKYVKVTAWSLMAVFALFLMVPLSNIARAFTIDIKEAYLSNSRYPFIAFIFCAPIISTAVLACTRALSFRTGQMLSTAVSGLIVIVLAGGAVTGLRKWTYYDTPDPVMSVVASDLAICDLASRMRSGGIWLTDRYSVSYYCDRRPIYLYTPFGRAFFINQPVQEAYSKLKRNNVELVVFANASPSWWPSTSLYAALNSAESGKESANRRSIGYWQVFILE